MEKLPVYLVTLLCFFDFCNGIESPQFTVLHSESDFEIRLYRESSWMSAPVQGISFEKATKEGFHRLYQYIHGANFNSSRLAMTSPILTSINPGENGSDYYVRFYISTKYMRGPPKPRPELNLQVVNWEDNCVAVRKFSGFASDDNIVVEVKALVTGLGRFGKGNSTALEEKYIYTIAQLFQYIQGANLNSSRIRMTAPVLTSIVPGAGPLHSSAYFIRFYLPVKFQATPPLPLPELNLQPNSWVSRCIAVRKFSGFARDGNIVKEAEKLAVSLSRSPWANSTSSEVKDAYSIAQYNSPFRFIGRENEVWVDLDGSKIEGCGSRGVATY